MPVTSSAARLQLCLKHINLELEHEPPNSLQGFDNTVRHSRSIFGYVASSDVGGAPVNSIPSDQHIREYPTAATKFVLPEVAGRGTGQ